MLFTFGVLVSGFGDVNIWLTDGLISIEQIHFWESNGVASSGALNSADVACLKSAEVFVNPEQKRICQTFDTNLSRQPTIKQQISYANMFKILRREPRNMRATCVQFFFLHF